MIVNYITGIKMSNWTILVTKIITADVYQKYWTLHYLVNNT